jgi:DNA-binding transcriptional regulator YiaG
MPRETLADLVKRRRAELGLTQTQLAEELGVKLRAVQYWEAGTNEPNLTVQKLLALLKPRREDK